MAQPARPETDEAMTSHEAWHVEYSAHNQVNQNIQPLNPRKTGRTERIVDLIMSVRRTIGDEESRNLLGARNMAIE
jgi:hypothetical protein